MTPVSSSSLSGPSESIGATPGAVYVQQDPAYNNVHNRFPSVAFLDAEACRYGGIAVPLPAINVPVVSIFHVVSAVR